MPKICCLCGYECDGHGHKAQPVKDGECCDECNAKLVIPARSTITKLRIDEIMKLKSMLTEKKIPFVFRTISGGFLIDYPDTFNRLIRVSETLDSFGTDMDLLEIVEKRGNNLMSIKLEGYLSAEDVFKRIEAHWKKAMLLLPCPQCGEKPMCGHACGEYFIFSKDKPLATCMCSSFITMHSSPITLTTLWNRAVRQYEREKTLSSTISNLKSK